jgi:hypothetical protein
MNMQAQYTLIQLHQPVTSVLIGTTTRKQHGQHSVHTMQIQ